MKKVLLVTLMNLMDTATVTSMLQHTSSRLSNPNGLSYWPLTRHLPPSGKPSRINSLETTLLLSSINSILFSIPNMISWTFFPIILTNMIPYGINDIYAAPLPLLPTETLYLLFFKRFSNHPRLKQPYSSILFQNR